MFNNVLIHFHRYFTKNNAAINFNSIQSKYSFK